MREYNRIELMQADTDELLTYYENRIDDLMDEIITLQGWDSSRLGFKSNYCFREIYKELFKPLKCDKVPNNQASILDYENDDLLFGLLDIYSNVCAKYEVMPLLQDFSVLTGIATDTMYQWENDLNASRRKRSAIHKELIKRASSGTRQKLFSNGVGTIAIANNDVDAGLMYNRQRLIDSATVQALEVQTLPKLTTGIPSDS